MNIKVDEVISKLLFAAPFVVGAIIFFILGLKPIGRFYNEDYKGNKKEKFIDNIKASVCCTLAALCVANTIMIIIGLGWGMAILTSCIGLLCLPISVIGLYVNYRATFGPDDNES
jgi:hypothetical protein